MTKSEDIRTSHHVFNMIRAAGLVLHHRDAVFVARRYQKDIWRPSPLSEPTGAETRLLRDPAPPQSVSGPAFTFRFIFDKKVVTRMPLRGPE